MPPPKNSIIYKTFGNKANDSKLGASCSTKILLYKTFENKTNDSKLGASCSPKILLYTKPLEIKLMTAILGPHAPPKFYYQQNLWK